jgi:DMSO/TMAO reductase YedYZ molybdopterin-dependent catalytic subunit
VSEHSGDATPPEEPEAGSPIGRRIVLAMAGLGAAGIVWGAKAQSGLERMLRPITLRDPTGLSNFVPSAGRFRIYSVTGGLPHESAIAYRLRVHGLVDRPTTFTLDDLRRLPPTALAKDFQCVTGWRVPDVHWKGVALSRLLDEVGAKPEGRFLTFYSFDGTYTESLTVEQARRPDVIAAYEMIGKTVTREHGGPVRLYVAPMYGYKSLKWLQRIEVTDTLQAGFWEGQGYDVDGWVGRSNGRSDEPT